MPSEVIAKISVSVTGLDQNHQVVELAHDELVDDLRDSPDLTVQSVGAPRPGSKGWAEDTAVLIGSLGGGATLVKLVKLWLGRDKKRSVKVSIKRPTKPPIVIEATGENMSIDGLNSAIEQALNADNDLDRE